MVPGRIMKMRLATVSRIVLEAENRKQRQHRLLAADHFSQIAADTLLVRYCVESVDRRPNSRRGLRS